MPDEPKQPRVERFPWATMRAEIASGATRTWADLRVKYGVRGGTA